MSPPSISETVKTFIYSFSGTINVFTYEVGGMHSFSPYLQTDSIVKLMGFICLIVAGMGIVISLRETTEFRFFIALICLVPITMAIISRLIIPIFNYRQLSGFVPEGALMLAVGLNYFSSLFTQTRNSVLNKILILFVTAIILLNSFNIYLMYTLDTKNNWRGTAKYIEEAFRKGDVILTSESAIPPFSYYYRGGYRKAKTVRSIKEIKAILPMHKRVWLIFVDGDTTLSAGEIFQYVNTTTHKVTRKNFEGINLFCYEVR